jgi:hypothetical protein
MHISMNTKVVSGPAASGGGGGVRSQVEALDDNAPAGPKNFQDLVLQLSNMFDIKDPDVGEPNFFEELQVCVVVDWRCVLFCLHAASALHVPFASCFHGGGVVFCIQWPHFDCKCGSHFDSMYFFAFCFHPFCLTSLFAGGRGRRVQQIWKGQRLHSR